MIDRITIYKTIELDRAILDKTMEYENRTVDMQVNQETGEIIRDSFEIDRYIYKNKGLAIIYSNKTNKLTVAGRLPNISVTRNLVYNLDDYMITQKKLTKYDVTTKEKDRNKYCIETYYDVDDNLVYPDQWEEEIIEEYAYENLGSILNKVNEKLYELTSVKLDIRKFTVSYLEVCFNIFKVENVDKYIELFNLIFKHKNDKRYINFALKHNKLLGSSFYVKSKSNYEKNTNNSYTINFYNKLDQLKNLENNDKSYANVTLEDKELAENVLRLEVKLAYKSLIKTSKVFFEFLDIDFCAKILIDKYKYFISKNDNLDFYCYKRAKEIISNTKSLNEKEKKSLLKYIQNKHKCNKKSSTETQRKYNKMLEKLGIHYYFIPTAWGIDFMKSPIKLLRNKIEDIELTIDNM